MKIVNDLFKTRQPDGSLRWDMTNPAWSVTPWLASAIAYTAVGIFGAIQHPETFHLMHFAAGAAALYSGGGIGVMFHSRANV